MKLVSKSWTNGDRIPPRFAAGRPDAESTVAFSDDVNPHLAWDEAPAGTRSFVLVCHDFDVPSVADDVNQPGREVPSDLLRVDFYHWLMVDIPAQVREIAEGAFSRGFVARGKTGPSVEVPGFAGARSGLNDFTSWFGAEGEFAGRYYGYDGPFPPFNDSLVHHYVFTLYAVSVERLAVEDSFNGAQVREALAGKVLAEATYSGTYTLNPRLID